MKRFLVTDLFHSHKSYPPSEWTSVKEELPNQRAGIFKIRLENGNEVKAYYFEDMAMNVMAYFKDRPSHWYDKGTGFPLYNVTHWKNTGD